MKLRISTHEAARLRSRIQHLGLTQKQIAEQLGVSDRYIREILSLKKDKPIRVDPAKLEELMAILGIGYEHIFQEKLDLISVPHPQIDGYVRHLKTRMYHLLSKDSTENTHNQQLAQYLQDDKAVNKTMGFWYTLIVKTIADKYKVMRHFFNENDFFNIIPKQGYWRKFRHDASQQKNCYFSFKLIPSKPNSLFKIAYTLESPIPINPMIPRKIKIVFGQIEQLSEYILVTQFHDTPGSYKIKSSQEIIVTTWLDEANHDFILLCENDFHLETINPPQPEKYILGVKTKREVREMFHELETVLFPRNHLFHRLGKQDMGDDPIFFWNNLKFLELNADLLNNLLDDAPSAS
ncbi:helix-turn-helix transcriptional regulator [uncultured Thiothrix sp.]|uniref:helix-turn-helix domain-containing protein n=1 Tax=uncultured Thiothrix sp. TaxID=223185 RepID=UPI00261B08CC|nr:helix-turn-helix transcriptional regulator [uncultured Thiothrix sp.]